MPPYPIDVHIRAELDPGIPFRGPSSIEHHRSRPVVCLHELDAPPGSTWRNTKDRLLHGATRDELVRSSPPVPHGGLLGGATRKTLPERCTLPGANGQPDLEYSIPPDLTQGLSDTKHNNVVHALRAGNRSNVQEESTQTGRRISFEVDAAAPARGKRWRVAVEVLEAGPIRQVDHCLVRGKIVIAETPRVRGHSSQGSVPLTRWTPRAAAPQQPMVPQRRSMDDNVPDSGRKTYRVRREGAPSAESATLRNLAQQLFDPEGSTEVDPPSFLLQDEVRIANFDRLRDLENRDALSDYRAFHGPLEPDDSTRWQTPLRFLAGLEDHQPALNVDSYLHLAESERRKIAREFVDSHTNRSDSAMRRQELAFFLAHLYKTRVPDKWQAVPTPDDWNATRGLPTWEAVIPNYRHPDTDELLTQPHRDALQRHCRHLSIAGMKDSSLRSRLGELANVLRGLERSATSLAALCALDDKTLDASVTRLASSVTARANLLKLVHYETDSAVRVPQFADPRNGTDARSAARWLDRCHGKGHEGDGPPAVKLLTRMRLYESDLVDAAGDPVRPLRELALLPSDAWAKILQRVQVHTTHMHSVRAFRAWAHVDEFSRSQPQAAAHVEGWLIHRVDARKQGNEGFGFGRAVWNVPEFACSDEWSASVETYLDHAWPDQSSANRQAALAALDAFRTWVTGRNAPGSNPRSVGETGG